MSNQSFLLPANSKKSGKYFNFMNEIDVGIAATGILTTFALFLIFRPEQLIGLILTLLPMLLAAFLVFPIPNYHNIRTALYDIFKYYTGRRQYVWRGWCYRYEWSKDTK